MKKVAPIIVSIIVSIFVLAIYVLPFVKKNDAIYITYLLPITGIAIIIALVYVLVERLKEIEKEKDDDLSKY